MMMSTEKINKHQWNVICVKKFRYPMPTPIEFRVKSKTQLGAAMKAKNKLKKMEEDWIIKSIYWLDPTYYIDEK
jgi:hypothetical protein